MDIRVQKTEAAIKKAFTELRAQRPVEKVSVKELCRLAQINKSTFYAHYEDIYALSAAMQTEAIAYVLGTISGQSEWSMKDPGGLVQAIFQAVSANRALIDCLFSAYERTRLADALERGIKEMIFEQYPGQRENMENSILLSYCIQGAYHAYLNNQEVEEEVLMGVLERTARTLEPLLMETVGKN